MEYQVGVSLQLSKYAINDCKLESVVILKVHSLLVNKFTFEISLCLLPSSLLLSFTLLLISNVILTRIHVQVASQTAKYVI